MKDHTHQNLIEVQNHLLYSRPIELWEDVDRRAWRDYSALRLSEIYEASIPPELCTAVQEVGVRYRRALEAGEPLWNIVGQLLRAIVVNEPLGSMTRSEVVALARYASVARWVGLLADGYASDVCDQVSVFDADDLPTAIADLYAYEAGVLGRPSELTQSKWTALVNSDSLLGTAPGLIVLGWALHNDFVAAHEEAIRARTIEYLAMQSTHELDAAVV